MFFFQELFSKLINADLFLKILCSLSISEENVQVLVLEISTFLLQNGSSDLKFMTQKPIVIYIEIDKNIVFKKTSNLAVIR